MVELSRGNLDEYKNMDNKCKKCRRIGEKLFLKGEKCYAPKCALVRKPYPPGILGKKKGKRSRRGVSEYGAQLKERQKIKLTYGLRQRQFENYFKEASKKKSGDAVSAFFMILESRLDNVIFRLGFSESRSGARQIVSHGHIMVNGKRVNIPSYETRIGEKISIRLQSVNKGMLKDLDAKFKKYNPPSWIKLDKQKKEGEIIGRPQI